MTSGNPFLSPSPLDYELPDFPSLSLEHVVPAVEEGIAAQRTEIARILAEPNPDWQNTVEALEKSGAILDRATSWFFNLQGTDHTEEFDAVAAKIIPALSRHTDDIFQDPTLYARVRDVEVPGDEESRRLHRLLTARFTRRGAALDSAGRTRLAEINARLAQLSEEFGRNLLADTRALAVRFDSADELAGLPQERIDAAYDSDAATWVLPLELPTVQSVLAELTEPATRQKVLDASLRRGRESNVEVLLESARLRAEKARLLGYRTHADFVIAEETADDAAAARQLLTDLAPAAGANAAAERKLAADLAGEELAAADWPYWAARLREQDQGISDGELRAYFPLHQVLEDGVFYAAQRLYGISVTRRHDLRAYRDDVAVWEVTDADGTGLGLLLTDYAARASKRGGAWMSTFATQSTLTGQKPVVVNVMSITMPADGSDPLLSVDEVTTVFHEFGHALHGLMSNVRYPSISGTNVPRDWVEFPSQINENWAFDDAVVANYARHHATGDPIPASYLEAVARQRQEGQGFATAEYLAAAIIDLAWHSLSAEEVARMSTIDDIDAFEARALEEAGLDVEKLYPRYRSTYFNHIFAGGYSAGYYSYLWAEALDADGFDWFIDAGAAGASSDPDSVRQAGEKFRDHILARGAGIDYGAAFTALRGRGRDVTALLRRRGLAGTAV